jgi:hypothetical protein
MRSFSRNQKTVIRKQLQSDDFETVKKEILAYPARRVINMLISLYCDNVPLIRWRAIETTGAVVSRHAETDMESARVIMRRFLWMLNDESGGIGWGVPEAMGEVMATSDRLAMEFHRVFLSYVQPACNFLEHPMLQRGVLWGLGRLAQKKRSLVCPVLPDVEPFLESGDPYHRGLAALVIGYAGTLESIGGLELLSADITEIEIYESSVLKTKSVSDCCRFAIQTIKIHHRVSLGKDP